MNDTPIEQNRSSEPKPHGRTGLSDEVDREHQTQAKRLLKIADKATYWHTPAGDAFATTDEKGHRENHELSGRGFRDWLLREYFCQTKSAPTGQILRDVLATLEGRARFDGEKHPVFLRVAHRDERVYIDLCTHNWSVVEVSARGWKIVSDAPVRFRRAPKMLALPTPVECDPEVAILKLNKFLNLESFMDFQLTIGWIMSCFLPEGAFPVMPIYGEQGTGKSTFVRVIRAVVDPNESPLRKAPKNSDDLMVSAMGNHVVGFDNLSFLTEELSDDICRLATGAGLSKRSHYTNSEETVLSAKRPCILNGIEQFVTRGDLADRSISISLPVIAEDKRMREETFWTEFNEAKSEIFGAICYAIQRGLKDKDTFEMPSRPRMADAFHWISSCEVAFGWARFSSFEAFKVNQDEMAEVVLAGSPLFAHIDRYAKQGFRGTAELLLSNFRGDCGEREWRYLPGNASALSNRLRRLAPPLRRFGIEIEFAPRTAREKIIFLRKRPIIAVIPVNAVQDMRVNDANVADDGDSNIREMDQ